MRKLLLPFALALAAAMSAQAGTLGPGGTLNGLDGWPGQKFGISWIAKDLKPGTKIKVTLLRNGASLRVLATGLSLTNEASPQRGPILRGNLWWTPTAADIGCNYAALVATEDGALSFTTETFGVFAAMAFPTKGGLSNVRVDQPVAGRVLVLGQQGAIAWSLIANPKHWPSKKLKLELFYDTFKVGDIADVPLDFTKCPASGSYSWIVGKLTSITNYSRIPDGKNLVPGNSYWVRASGDGSSYFGPVFVIAPSSGMPAAVGTHVPKPVGGASPPLN